MMRIAARPVIAGVALLAVNASAARAQMARDSGAAMGGTPGAIPEARAGSGTSWLPDASPMRAYHFTLHAWTLMVHGAAFLQYDAQGGPRGASQLGLVNWAMLAASRRFAGGRVELRGMLSAEPATIGAAGYPLLLETGETYQGAPLHDRQHPHDLFMELSGTYGRPLVHGWSAFLYLAPVGEPALGPVAFPHRPSAAGDPLAPLGHHWQDATHVTYGVVTAGLSSGRAKLEASIFNGREPDEDRTDLDYAGRRLDSYAGRLAMAPGPHWALSAWYGYLKSPDALRPTESLHRFGAAALTSQSWGERASWSGALIYGANAHTGGAGGGALEHSALLETNLEFAGRNTLFTRIEYVRKSAAELAIPSVLPGTEYDLESMSLGFVRELGHLGPVSTGAGVVGTLSFVPAGLQAVYGSRTPTGVAVYLRFQPPSAGELMRGMSEMMNTEMSGPR
jgi:hypothetical protein